MKKILIFLLLTPIAQSCFFTNGTIVNLGMGSSFILGGSSWGDPLGAQVSIESKIIEVNENSSLKGGLGVSLQGSSYTEPYVSGVVKLAYLNLPVLYNYEFCKGFYGEIGLQPGLLISAKDKYNGESYDYKDYVRKIELGLPVGVGYRLNDKINLGARATYGIINMDNSGEGNDHNLLIVGLVSYTVDWYNLK